MRGNIYQRKKSKSSNRKRLAPIPCGKRDLFLPGTCYVDVQLMLRQNLQSHMTGRSVVQGEGGLARIIHIKVNNLPSGLRLRPAFAGRRSGLALSPSTLLGIETGRCGRARTRRRIIHEDTPFVNNAG